MVIYIIVGIVILLIFAITIILNKRRTVGVMLIDGSNPEKEIYRMVVTKPFDDLKKHKKIILVVKSDAHLSDNDIDI